MKVFSVATIATAQAASTNNSGVVKVIELLGKMKSQVIEETAAGAKAEEEFQDQCIASTTELKSDIKYGSEKAEELSAQKENESAKAEAFGVDSATLAPQIAKLEEEKKSAKEIRGEENKEYMAEEAELEEASGMLTQAYSVLKRSLSLMQTGGKVPNMEKVVQALSAVINAAWIDPQSARRLESLLESSDELSLKAPQASTSNYGSKSGGILDAIEELQSKTAEQLSKLRRDELDKKHSFELLAQDLTSQVETKSEMLASAQQNKADAEEAAGKASADLATTAESVSADKTQLSDTQSDCKTSGEEWGARKASADGEVAALTKAVDILSAKFSLLQTGARTHTAGDDAREKAATILRKLGHKFNSFGLLQAASSAQEDPFGKVRGLISDMIMKLEKQAADEASKEGKCKADIANGTRDVKVKTEQMNKVATRLDSSQAKYAQLGSEVSALNEELKELNTNMQAWTRIRNEEKADSDAVVKNAAESIEALSAAITTLTEFYGAPALLQTGQPKSEAANVIIETLQTAQEDFEKLKQETETAERNAEDAFDRNMQAAKVATAKKSALVEGKTQERSGVKVMISQLDSDVENATKAFEAARTYLKNKKEECANKSMSYEERKRRREEEIKGLQEALEILSADASFLQTGAFLARK